MLKKKNINERKSQSEEANILLRIITFIAGVFTIVIVALLEKSYSSFNLYMIISGLLFTVIYLFIFVLTFTSDYVKRKATNILYTIYYLSSISMLCSLYMNKGNENFIKILLLVTFAVILGLRQMVHLVIYIIVMSISIIGIFLSFKNNTQDNLINLTIFAMFFILSYVNFKSKLITEEALLDAEENVKQMAYFDAVTGLPNRYKLNIYVEELLKKIAGRDVSFAILFIDLDNFKNINDSLGHNFGDKTLDEVAKILVNCVRKDDIVSRYGGDEFIIIVNNISKKESVLIANRIINEFKKPLLIDGNEIYTSTSIGISLYPSDGVTVDSLIKNADAAMYEAKSNGKNNFCFFNKDFNEIITRRVELENGLRRALEREEFYLHYQPQVYLETGELWGIEALIRWNHPTLGIISPLEFIPIAEEMSLITSIGEWVIGKACKQNKLWQDEGLDIVPIGINVSALQLKDSNFVEVVKMYLNKTKLDSKYIVIELTESIMQDMNKISEVVNNLKSLGVKVAIDDFGTGYSSLSLLKNLNIDILKIDPYFIKDIDSNLNTVAIINFICEMGNKLKFNTLIEGIESLEQSNILNKNGCRLGQGYLFSKPLDAAEVKKHLKNK
ncbi:EAL domain-containing protein [Clostridium sp. SHJSY1]|uniref:putative bifunctional diguanylate cyclase/phosphodiesterase n=1 Tax=Clostridium sp. SHJSY1 TaxID=2942483 RepID=UPI002877076B|nr:EAL domain-containing protein [Clostridium sp. SHJSY1]MDS0525204.1 EAL domain-containing protein [Clostridium sp. SHJSY1]